MIASGESYYFTPASDPTHLEQHSTLLLDAFAIYQQMTGAVLDSATGLLKITSAQYANLESLFFTIGGVSTERPLSINFSFTHGVPIRWNMNSLRMLKFGPAL